RRLAMTQRQTYCPSVVEAADRARFFALRTWRICGECESTNLALPFVGRQGEHWSLPRRTTWPEYKRVEMDSSTQRSDGFAMAVVVEGGLALVALGVAWLFRVTLRDMFPAVGPPLVGAIVRGLLATL